MIFIYGVISFLYILLLIGVSYYFNKSYQASKKNRHQFSEEYSIIIPFKNDPEKVENILKYIDNERLGYLQKVVLVDDGSKSFDLKYKSKNFNTELVTLERNVGKTQAIKEGLKTLQTPFVCILDVDIFWNTGSFKNLIEGHFIEEEQLNILPFEEEFDRIKWLQFEEVAIKGVTYASVACNKPQLMSSAALFGKKSLIESHIKNYTAPHGWDMSLLKTYANKLHWIFPAQNRTLKTKAESTYLKYLKQRVRWVNNSFRNPSITLFLIGIFILVSFSLDLTIFFSFFFLPLQFYFYLISIFVIKTISSIIAVKNIGKHFSNWVHPLQIIQSHLLYGLNIGIILIFLVLRQIKERT